MSEQPPPEPATVPPGEHDIVGVRVIDGEIFWIAEGYLDVLVPSGVTVKQR